MHVRKSKVRQLKFVVQDVVGLCMIFTIMRFHSISSISIKQKKVMND